MSNYTEIIRLKKMLEKENIPFTFEPLYEGFHITVMSDNHSISIIEHRYSYGNEKDLLEIFGGLTKEEKKDDAVLGYLTAEEVFKRVKYCLEYDTDEYIDDNCTQMDLVKRISKLFSKIGTKKYTHAKVNIETWCDQPYLRIEFYAKGKHNSKEDVLKTPLIDKSYIDMLGKEFVIDLT